MRIDRTPLLLLGLAACQGSAHKGERIDRTSKVEVATAMVTKLATEAFADWARRNPTKDFPLQVSELGRDQPDPWGHEYSVDTDHAGAWILSRGPDGRRYTADDIRIQAWIRPLIGLTGIDPASGTAAGGTRVNIYGHGFVPPDRQPLPTIQVYFGGRLAPVGRINGDQQIYADTPIGIAGEVEVEVVFEPGGRFTVGEKFRYTP